MEIDRVIERERHIWKTYLEGKRKKYKRCGYLERERDREREKKYRGKKSRWRERG